jgi:cysteine desulfurase family protein (TIGR01976 family)
MADLNGLTQESGPTDQAQGVRSVALDETWVREQFAAFSDPRLQGFVHLENAGGSWACDAVRDRLADFYRATKLQPYYPSAPSTAGGAAMDAARSRMAAWLNVSTDAVHFGPSTTQNTFNLANAFRQHLSPGDEIIVTNQDHEANIGAWSRLANEGFVVREWCVDPHNAELRTEDLEALLNDRTRVVAFTHCSNIVGSINPVAAWCDLIRKAGALSVVDGVSYAPHGLPDVTALGADIYLFSMYKTYGPHLGVMTVRPELTAELPNQGHFFNAGHAAYQLTPAGPDHAQIAAAGGVIDYLEALDAHHYPGENAAAANQRVHDLFQRQEQTLTAPLLDFLGQRSDVRLIGKGVVQGRAPTVAFETLNRSPREVAEALAAEQLGVGYGHFYAYRLMEALRIAPERGVLRCSMAHYNTAGDVARLTKALDRHL